MGAFLRTWTSKVQIFSNLGKTKSLSWNKDGAKLEMKNERKMGIESFDSRKWLEALPKINSLTSKLEKKPAQENPQKMKLLLKNWGLREVWD